MYSKQSIGHHGIGWLSNCFVFRLLTMDDYGYLNARVHAMQGRLLSRSQYDELLGKPTTHEVLEQLLTSPYSKAILGTSETIAEIQRLEEGLRIDLCTHLRKIRKMATAGPRVLLDAALFRWDVENLKAILRGARVNVPVEELLASTIPVGMLDEVALAELARTRSLMEVADLLETWRIPIGKPIRNELREHGEPQTLLSLEVAMDRFAFSHSIRLTSREEEQGRQVKKYLLFLVDQVNTLMAFRCLTDVELKTFDAAEMYFLDVGGRLTRQTFHSIVSARDTAHGLSQLMGTPFEWLAHTAQEENIGSVSSIERRLREALLRETRKLAHWDALGIGVVLRYVERKINEVRNLRLLMRGKARGLSATQITEWLVFEHG